MRLISLLTALSLFQLWNVNGQGNPGIKAITAGTKTSLRGMAIASEKVIWVSGSSGTIGKSVDGGESWRWMVIPGFETRDFRDIEAFDSSTAMAMAVDNPAYLIKTTDGGATWKKVFERSLPGMFLDAMDFKNRNEGICIGDPVSVDTPATFYILRTYDSGESGSEVPAHQLPAAHTGEALFAASGTNISFLDHPDYEYAFVTGGTAANLHLVGRQGKNNKVFSTPIIKGKESTGIFSMATDNRNAFWCIGGDYKRPASTTDNYYVTTNVGDTWSPSSTPPSGYRSCIRIIDRKTIIACGTTGVDLSENGRKNWTKVSNESFNVCGVPVKAGK